MKKTNIPVCVISLSSVIKKEYTYFPVIKLQRWKFKKKIAIKTVSYVKHRLPKIKFDQILKKSILFSKYK